MIPRKPEWLTLEERVLGDGRRAGLKRPAIRSSRMRVASPRPDGVDSGAR